MSFISETTVKKAKKPESRSYTAAEMFTFVGRLVAWWDDRDWREMEVAFPDEYEREVCKSLAAEDGEPMRCFKCRWWKWNKDAPGGCSLNVVGKCDKYENKTKREDWE